LKLLKVHITHVLCLFAMAMILLNDMIEELSEMGVTIVAASVDANARVDVLAAGEDGLLESEAKLVMTVMKLFP
jgi:hypothetical protein